MPDWQIIQGDALAVLRTMASESVHCVCTSPPYWGLRDYSVDGQFGLEKSPEEFIEKMVEVFREVKRVLRKDGTLWLNIGDSFSVGANISDCFDASMKSGPFFFGNTASIRVSGKRGNISLHDQRFPNGIFLNLLGMKRVTIKQRNNDLCQILNTLATPSYCWVDCPILFVHRNVSDVEIFLDAEYDISIVISDHNSDVQPEFCISWITTGPRKNNNTSFSVEKTTEPITEIISDIQSAGNPFSFDAPTKRLPDIYFINKSIPFGDGLDARASERSDFKVTSATSQQISFQCGHWRITFSTVSHLFISNNYGSLVTYCQLYDKAYRKSRALLPKQEIGIPDLLKRALMEDGWICRSTIIWAKPNPMPESCTDRPTKAHEQVFLLTKSPRYFYDAEAVKEPGVEPERKRGDKIGHTQRFLAGRPITEFAERTTTRNKRTVWQIASEPFSGLTETSRLVRVALGVVCDGMKRKASLNCPVHGDRSVLAPKVFCDEYATDSGSHTSRTEICLDSLQQTDCVPTETPPEHCSFLDTKDCLGQKYSETAIDHNNQKSKKGRAPETSPSYIPCEEIPSRTGDKRESPSCSDSVGHKIENNTSQGGLADHLLEQKLFHIVDKSSLPVPPECCCEYYQIKTEKTSHFATFPCKLVEPMILAGTSERGCCAKCLAPWERVIEASPEYAEFKKSEAERKGHGMRSSNLETLGLTAGIGGNKSCWADYQTTGWRATCKCNAGDPIPCTVLDIFSGAGTTVMVALRHGRRGIGIELSPEYCAMARQRIEGDCPLFNSAAL